MNTNLIVPFLIALLNSLGVAFAESSLLVDAENQELVAVSEDDALLKPTPKVDNVINNGEGKHASSGSAASQPKEEEIDLGSGIKIRGQRAYFPPLSRTGIDYLFDKLRSGGLYTPPPVKQSQNVSANVVGIWAGVRSSLESKLELITLRFRPTHEARLKRAQPAVKMVPLAEYFDIELHWKNDVEFVIRHQFAEDRRAQFGVSVRVGEVVPNPLLIELIKGYRDTGVYLAWPQTLAESVKSAWSLLVCPRTPKLVQEARVSEVPKLILEPSSYELSEVYLSISGVATARMAPTDRPERIAVSVFSTEDLPPATRNSDISESLYPRVEVPYVAGAQFKFFNFPLISGTLQAGLLARIENRNPAGHIRRQYNSHLLYITRLNEPSPVGVYMGEYKAAKDEGLCYIVSEQRNVWNEYEREGGAGN